MGEGSTVLVMESEESAIKRGADIYGYVAGYGATTDAFHKIGRASCRERV